MDGLQVRVEPEQACGVKQRDRALKAFMEWPIMLLEMA
jgi:hypothetical protein